MNLKTSILLSTTLFFVFVKVNGVFAQETILPEVSQLYVEKLIAAAKDNYPRIKSLNSQIEVAKKDLTAVQVSWLDPFSFQYVGRSNQANTNVVNVTTADILTGYQFGVSFSPASLFAKPSNIKKAKEQINIAKYNKDEYLLNLESEVKKRYFLYLQYQKSLIPFNNALMDAESSFKKVKIAYERGESTLEQYNSASTSYYNAYQAKLQGEVNFMSAKTSLEELTVLKLEGIK